MLSHQGQVGSWLPLPGPYGRGPCLIDLSHEAFVEILAPPGVPLQQPERMDRLGQWRLARWTKGGLVAPPIVLDVVTAMDLAAEHSDWVRAAARDWADVTASLPTAADDLTDAPEGQPGQRLVLALPPTDRERSRNEHQRIRPPAATSAHARAVPHLAVPTELECADEFILDRTSSASTFAAFLCRLPASCAGRRIELAANTADRLESLNDQLCETAVDTGVAQTRLWIIALLRARSRSHSWRYTRVFGERQLVSALGAEIGWYIDHAPSGQALGQKLNQLRSEWADEVDEALVEILFTRSCAMRWRATSKPRVVLGDPRLQSARQFLRKWVQPFWARRVEPAIVQPVISRYQGSQSASRRTVTWPGTTPEPRELETAAQ